MKKKRTILFLNNAYQSHCFDWRMDIAEEESDFHSLFFYFSTYTSTLAETLQNIAPGERHVQKKNFSIISWNQTFTPIQFDFLRLFLLCFKITYDFSKNSTRNIIVILSLMFPTF